MDSASFPPAKEWLPRNGCNLPDLSHFDDQNLANMQLNLVFSRRGLHTQPAVSLLFNLARLVDHALREYGSARAACGEYAAGRHIAYFHAQSHLEALLISLWRSLQYARALQTLYRPESRDIPPIANSDLPRQSDEERISRVRGAILHTEERIRGGDIPTALVVTEDGVELSGERLEYRELAIWTEQVHAVTQRLVAYEGPLATGS